jgi:peptide deformylase
LISASLECEDSIESCLSLPGLLALVRRKRSVTVQFESLTGATILEELSGLPAAIYQHELDHLNGKLITDSPVAIRGASTRQPESFQPFEHA